MSELTIETETYEQWQWIVALALCLLLPPIGIALTLFMLFQAVETDDDTTHEHNER